MLAETARLIASLELKDKGFAATAAKAEGSLNRLDKSTSKIGRSKGFGGLTKSVGGLGKAFGNAGKAASGFASTIGPLLGIGGALGIGALFASSINKAEEFGSTIRKVQAITGESATATSAYVDVLDKFGIGSEKVTKLTGILEKNLATIGKTAKTAAKFQAEFGINVLDSSGHVANATTIFQRAVAFFNSNATASQKAAALNKLYGKSWQDMIPALKAGTATIKDEFGTALQLGNTQLANLDKFRKAQRDFADEFGDLQVTIGAEILPALIGPLKEFTGFLSAHRTDIVNFFKGAVQGAKEVGQAVKDFIIPAGKAIFDAFNAIPPDIRKLLIGGAIANKVLKVTFGFDPLKIVGAGIAGALKDSLGGFFQRGAPGNPMFVAVEGGAGALGATGGLAKEGTLFGKLAGVAIKLSLLGIVAELATEFGPSIIKAGADIGKSAGADKGPLGFLNGVKDLEWPFGPKNTPKIDVGPFKDILGGRHQTAKAMTPSSTVGFTGFEGRGAGFRPTDAIGNRLLGQAAQTQIKKLDQLHQDFIAQRAILQSGTDAQKATAAAALAKDVQKGVGNVANTKDLAAQLRATALTVKDPELRKQINAAASRIEGKIQGREWVAAQKAAAAKIARSNESVGQKVRELKGIQQSLIAHGDTAAAKIVGALLSGVVPAINSLKNGININLPGVLPPTSPTHPRNTNAPPTPHGGDDRRPRTGFALSITPAPVTHRDVSKAKVIRHRIGGTPADVGAI